MKRVLRILSKPFELIKFVKDRPGHDFRYSIDNSKSSALCPNLKFVDLDKGLNETIRWYKHVLSTSIA